MQRPVVGGADDAPPYCYTRWAPEDRPVHERRWRLKPYALPNRLELLLRRVKRDVSV